MSEGLAVKVAIRIRPLVPKELAEGCESCLETVAGEHQIILRAGTDEKAFTFDNAYDPTTSQEYVYRTCVLDLVQKLFKGFNTTVLAYGQTGSGKTFSMGTAYTAGDEVNEMRGIIPRALEDIFHHIRDSDKTDYLVKISFLELYKEHLFDLLSLKTKQEAIVDIREDPKYGIVLSGQTEMVVTSVNETLNCLEKGSLGRATGATAMNSRSSRSHAIFIMIIEQKNKDGGEVTVSRFNFVDLAGSERAKKTKASGDRFKEGVDINKGLLSLGNVISALCDKKPFIPYRDSKLTRMLQDSLGGNSHTVMVGCVSPADSNLEETLSTLRYADRARKIKNKPVVNRDPRMMEMAKLKGQIQQLQVQLIQAQALTAGGGGVGAVGSDPILLETIDRLETENTKLKEYLQDSIDQNVMLQERSVMAEAANERLKIKLCELHAQTDDVTSKLNKTIDCGAIMNSQEQLQLLNGIKDKVVEIKESQEQNVQKMQEHELSHHEQEAEVGGEDGEEGDESRVEDDGYEQKHLLKRADLNNELKNLNKNLAEKERLVRAMSTNNSGWSDVQTKYEATLKSLSEQIVALNEEKADLNKALSNKGTTGNPNAAKIAEQRRKKLQECEQQISDLKRKTVEQQKLLKLRERESAKLKVLDTEIQNMKRVRVKLIKQAREDTEKFRCWKVKKEKEITQLKNQDRKRQYEKVKMESMHSKQQNVLKRKVEEAVSANKRLKEALALQKSVKGRRDVQKQREGVECRDSKLADWLSNEVEVAVSTKEAERTLKHLIDDRKSIKRQIEKLDKEIQSGNLISIKQAELESTVETLKVEAQVRTAQISDIQQKIIDADIDGKGKDRWESLTMMGEAKYLLKTLFDLFTQSKNEISQKEAVIDDLKGSCSDAQKNAEEIQDQMRLTTKKLEEKISQMQKENEEKTLYLLRHIHTQENKGEDSGDGEREKLIAFQTAEIERLNYMHEELLDIKKEKEELTRRLTTAHTNTPNALQETLLPAISDDLKFIPKSKKTFQHDLESDTEDEETEEDPESELDNSVMDPDWKKTPLFKKIRSFKKRLTTNKENKAVDTTYNKENSCGLPDADETLVVGGKRRSKNSGVCGCKSGCRTSRCNCFKQNKQCQGCRCSQCCNTEPHVGSEDDDDGMSSDSNRKPLQDANNSLNADSPRKRSQDNDGNDSKAAKARRTTRSSSSILEPQSDNEPMEAGLGVFTKKLHNPRQTMMPEILFSSP